MWIFFKPRWHKIWRNRNYRIFVYYVLFGLLKPGYNHNCTKIREKKMQNIWLWWNDVRKEEGNAGFISSLSVGLELMVLILHKDRCSGIYYWHILLAVRSQVLTPQTRTALVRKRVQWTKPGSPWCTNRRGSTQGSAPRAPKPGRQEKYCFLLFVRFRWLFFFCWSF